VWGEGVDGGLSSRVASEGCGEAVEIRIGSFNLIVLDCCGGGCRYIRGHGSDR